MSQNSGVMAAVIAAVVSLVGVIVTTVAGRWQVKSKIDELTQTQFKDVQEKRIEVYPKLWWILQTFTSDWLRANKPIDADWGWKLYWQLTDWHAQYGVFLSQPAYEAFVLFRTRVLEMLHRCDEGQPPTIDDITALDGIYTGPIVREGVQIYGLSTQLKNDLGSYKTPAIAVRS